MADHALDVRMAPASGVVQSQQESVQRGRLHRPAQGGSDALTQEYLLLVAVRRRIVRKLHSGVVGVV